MTKDKYDAEWQMMIERFLQLLTKDPWVDGRIQVAARAALRDIMDLKHRAAESAE